jgi:uncharacterized DUF497 family protein
MMFLDRDETKAASNERRHGITFVYATNVFSDPHAIFERDRGRRRRASPAGHRFGRRHRVAGRRADRSRNRRIRDYPHHLGQTSEWKGAKTQAPQGYRSRLNAVLRKAMLRELSEHAGYMSKSA